MNKKLKRMTINFKKSINSFNRTNSFSNYILINIFIFSTCIFIKLFTFNSNKTTIITIYIVIKTIFFSLGLSEPQSLLNSDWFPHLTFIPVEKELNSSRREFFLLLYLIILYLLFLLLNLYILLLNNIFQSLILIFLYSFHLINILLMLDYSLSLFLY